MEEAIIKLKKACKCNEVAHPELMNEENYRKHLVVLKEKCLEPTKYRW